MQGTTEDKRFGLLIGYVLPGYLVLLGLAPLFPAVGFWLQPVPSGDLGLGPPLYAVLGATSLGLVLSCFRWLIVDTVHHRTGIHRPIWDDRQLDDVLGGFDYLVQSHFRYYEFTANTLVALIFVYGLNRFTGTLPFLGPGTDLGMLTLATVLFAASRDALAKYYTRTGRLVGRVAEKAPRGEPMFNGNDHGGGGRPAAQPQPETKPPHEPKPPANPERPEATETTGNE